MRRINDERGKMEREREDAEATLRATIEAAIAGHEAQAKDKAELEDRLKM